MSDPSGNKRLSFFETLHEPYYLYASDFRQSSAGIRALHYLCHFLNECGYEAYITADTTRPGLRAPALNGRVLRDHFLAGKSPIVLYPEVVSGNPLGGDIVVRWLLNKPGHLGGDTHYPASDLIFYFDPWVLPEGMAGEHLRVPTLDWSIFNNRDNEFDDRRQGVCYYANKFLLFGGTIPEEIRREGISLGQEHPLSHEEIAAHLRRAEALYCFEQSAIIDEARACGCPVLIIPSDHNPISLWQKCPAGVALITQSPPLPQLRDELRGISNEQKDNFEYARQRVAAFIERTQHASRTSARAPLTALTPESVQLWRLPPAERRPHLAEFEQLYRQIYNDIDIGGHTSAEITSAADSQYLPDYRQWISARHEAIAKVSATQIGESRSTPVSFHLILRQQDGSTSALADTLENLGYQRHPHWRLDVITPLSPPPGIEGVAAVGWHISGGKETDKARIDALVNEKNADWIVELPPGAVLDPFCLWRLAQESRRHADTSAFFVDDDLYDDSGSRVTPRFKPGTNIECLKSSDLAGPLFLRREAWNAIGGASAHAASPWFGQLIRVAECFGWQTIHHVPDVLISYPGKFPSDTQTCLTELARHLLTQNLEPRFSRTSEASWRIGYTPVRPQHVTICIASQGRLDLLNRTVNSLLEHTDYPSFDIVISIPDKLQDDELSHWLGECHTLSGGAIRHLAPPGENSVPTQYRQLSASATGELLLFAEEGLAVNDNNWLRELAGLLDQQDIAAVSPRIIDAFTNKLASAGLVHSLMGITGLQHFDQLAALVSDNSGGISPVWDATILPPQCLLVRKRDYDAQGGLSTAYSSRDFAIADLCLRWRENGKRLVCTPLSWVLSHDWNSPTLVADAEASKNTELANAREKAEFSRRWLKNGARDPYWNPHFSLAEQKPAIETRFMPQWQFVLNELPSILSRPAPNSQGDYRINYYLDALSRAGKANACTWEQSLADTRQPMLAEICRLNADTLVVQNYTLDHHLEALHSLHQLCTRPFIVHTLDDLLTNLDPNSPFTQFNPPDTRSRIKYALTHSDRLVVSTDYLAESFQHLISDIRIVPNRLPSDLWLTLRNRPRSGKRPRIGWAGGITHHTDLLLLKEVILETRGEADWIFFGMCPPELRPLLAEFHSFAPREEYPARLAALNLDIAVAPLADMPFNHAKSNLRLLEYGILGIPVVCSDVEPYRGSPACLVENTTSQWVQALRDRIHNADAREEEGRMLRRWVHENYLIETHMDEWLAAHLP